MPVMKASTATRVAASPQAPIRTAAPAAAAPKAATAPATAPAKPIAAPRPAPAPLPTSLATPAVPALVTSQMLGTVKRGPGRPSRAEIAARDVQIMSPSPSPTPRAPVDNSALVAKINELAKVVEEQNITLAKLRAKPGHVRTLSEIVDGADNGIPADDWRLSYAGATCTVCQFDRDKSGRITLVHRDNPAYPAVPMLAGIPRMTDPGNGGTQMRMTGQLALYLPREDGNYEGFEGGPLYVNFAELAEIWA